MVPQITHAVRSSCRSWATLSCVKCLSPMFRTHVLHERTICMSGVCVLVRAARTLQERSLMARPLLGRSAGIGHRLRSLSAGTAELLGRLPQSHSLRASSMRVRARLALLNASPNRTPAPKGLHHAWRWNSEVLSHQSTPTHPLCVLLTKTRWE